MAGVKELQSVLLAGPLDLDAGHTRSQPSSGMNDPEVNMSISGITQQAAGDGRRAAGGGVRDRGCGGRVSLPTALDDCRCLLPAATDPVPVD